MDPMDSLKDVRVWRCRHLARRAGELWEVSLSRNGEPRSLLSVLAYLSEKTKPLYLSIKVRRRVARVRMQCARCAGKE